MTIEHVDIGAGEIHEPKGIGTANLGDVYVATGAGTGVWTDIAPNLMFIEEEADFPVQDATTITLETKTVYITTDPISTAKRFIVQDGAVLTALNLFGHVLTYTGTGTMFTGTDANFTLRDIEVDCPNAQAFDFTDTVGGVKLFIASDVTVRSCTKTAIFNNLLTWEFNNSAVFSTADGVTVTGANNLIASCQRFAQFSGSAGFTGIDFGSAVIANIELDNLVFVAPAGAFGLSGLVASGNIPVGSLAMVSNSSFVGGQTALQNITNTDIRWSFTSNTPIPDTISDALISLNGNVTPTVISSSSTPVKVEGTWVIERESLFTCDTTGRATYNGERDVVVPVDIALFVSPVSGTNKLIKAYVSLNGTIIANSGREVLANSGDPIALPVLWQLSLSETDYLEVFVENNTDSVNVLVSDGIHRVR